MSDAVPALLARTKARSPGTVAPAGHCHVVRVIRADLVGVLESNAPSPLLVQSALPPPREGSNIVLPVRRILLRLA